MMKTILIKHKISKTMQLVNQLYLIRCLIDKYNEYISFCLII